MISLPRQTPHQHPRVGWDQVYNIISSFLGDYCPIVVSFSITTRKMRVKTIAITSLVSPTKLPQLGASVRTNMLDTLMLIFGFFLN